MANTKKNIKKEINRSYMSKDFDSFRLDLQQFAQIYYPDNMQDFSESSLCGLMMDLAAYVGDSMSFYTDHQFRELDPVSAVETINLEKMAQNAGIKIPGAAPAVATVTFYLRIPAVQKNGEFIPEEVSLPIIQANTSLKTVSGISFFLLEDLNFSKRDVNGDYIAKTSKLLNTAGRNYFVMTMDGSCVSGKLTTEKISIPNSYQSFRTITLTNPDVSSISQVIDSELNEYYEVENLSQDTVFKSFPNNSESLDGVESNLGIIPAPYRFTVNSDIRTRQTRIQFGSGRSSNLADDGVPDPSSLSLPVYGKKTMSRFSLDPALLLDTKTLGITPQNTTITVTYRHGGGASHNVPPGSINDLDGLKIKFRNSLNASTAIDIRSSLEISNQFAAGGGSDRPTSEDIRNLIPSARNIQSRIVTKEDLLARLYMLPNEYGRIYRAGIVANPQNPLSSILYVVCTDRAGRLSMAPDVLKLNISKYLNEFRLISDSIDILDVRVLNFKVSISIIANPNSNKMLVVRTVLERVKKLLKRSNFQVGQPIIESDIVNTIINVPGVLSLVELRLLGVKGSSSGRSYSNSAHNFKQNYNNGIYFCSSGDIFELRFPDEDISVSVR